MMQLSICELWHHETSFRLVGPEKGDIVRITEKKDSRILTLYSGFIEAEHESFIIPVQIGTSELHRFSNIQLEWESKQGRQTFNLSEQVLTHAKDLRLLVTAFQKFPVDEVQTIAAVTIAFNEDYMLKKWTDYYGKILGYENLYIIDDGSGINPRDYLHKDVNVIRQPRTEFSSWRLCRSLSKLQRLLLETYDAVIVLDSDEFLVTNRSDCATIKEHIKSIFPNKTGIIAAQGWELIHLIDREPMLNGNIPMSRQRKYLFRNSQFDKPSVSNTEISLIIGNHWCYEDKTQDNDLIMLHLRYFDVHFSLSKVRNYRITSWLAVDIENGFSNHQRMSDGNVIEQFKGWIKSYDEAVLANQTEAVRIIPERWAAQLEWAG